MPKPEFPLLDDPGALARFQGWSEPVYRDLLALQRGELAAAEFDDRYLRRRAVLVLDLTGFTETAVRGGALQSFLRILDAQKVCVPTLEEHAPEFVRAFADDLVALFTAPEPALEAAFEIHRRVDAFNRTHPDVVERPQCCIGIGYGDLYAIGPNHAMGDEMNRASKLGEDTARGGETLVTRAVLAELEHRGDVQFEAQSSDDLIFPYFRVTRDDSSR